MDRSRIAAWWRATVGWLTLDGRIRVGKPGALVGAGLVAVLALALPSRWMIFLAYAALLLLLGAFAWVRALAARLRLERQVEAAWAQVGDELEERWEVANDSVMPLHWLEIDDASTLPGYTTRRVVSAAAGEQIQWRTTARCERRGVYQLGPLIARLSDPLGIFRFEGRGSAERRLVVYPPLVRLPALPLPRGLRGGLAQADLLQLHATPSVGGVRDYTPGDPPSRIHWPFVARHGRLVVKEFDQERAGALWLVLDLAAAAYPPVAPAEAAVGRQPVVGQSSVVSELAAEFRPASLPDLAITLVASLGAQALAEGRTVGLICDDGRRRAVQPASGPRQLWRMLNELVDGEATGARPLGALLRDAPELRGSGQAGAAIIVVTGALDAGWLPDFAARTGGRAGGGLALLIAAQATDAAPCEALLASRGVAAHTFTLGTALPLVNPPRRRVTARVSPLGRVIRDGAR